MVLATIAAGGALGALARFLVDEWVTERIGGAFPFGTLVVNLSGTFLVGLLATLIVDRGVLSAELRPFVLVGFVGAYTTFSTWLLESWRMLELGETGLAMANIVGSMVLGAVALVAGLVVGRAV